MRSANWNLSATHVYLCFTFTFTFAFLLFLLFFFVGFCRGKRLTGFPFAVCFQIYLFEPPLSACLISMPSAWFQLKYILYKKSTKKKVTCALSTLWHNSRLEMALLKSVCVGIDCSAQTLYKWATDSWQRQNQLWIIVKNGMSSSSSSFDSRCSALPYAKRLRNKTSSKHLMQIGQTKRKSWGKQQLKKMKSEKKSTNKTHAKIVTVNFEASGKWKWKWKWSKKNGRKNLKTKYLLCACNFLAAQKAKAVKKGRTYTTAKGRTAEGAGRRGVTGRRCEGAIAVVGKCRRFFLMLSCPAAIGVRARRKRRERKRKRKRDWAASAKKTNFIAAVSGHA